MDNNIQPIKDQPIKKNEVSLADESVLTRIDDLTAEKVMPPVTVQSVERFNANELQETINDKLRQRRPIQQQIDALDSDVQKLRDKLAELELLGILPTIAEEIIP